MATERLTISCDDCAMAGSTACTDCLVTFVVGGPLQVLPGGADELERSMGAHPAGRSRATRPAPVRAAGATAEARSPEAGPAGARRVQLSAEQAEAVRALAGAGLVGSVRFVPRAAG